MVGFPVKAVIFDWADTMIDFGCMAPVRALISVFEDGGIALTEPEARVDLGKAKRDHLAAILANPEVAARWVQHFGSPASEADIDRVYDKLRPAMIAAPAAARLR